MVDSGVGRPEGAEVGRLWPKAGPGAKTEHRDVRTPGTALDLAEKITLEPVCERRRVVVLAQGDHADTSGLAVPPRRKDGGRDAGCETAERLSDLADAAGRPPAEKRERDVQVGARDGPGIAGRDQLTGLPLDESVQDVLG
jgi:hypothetical protein